LICSGESKTKMKEVEQSIPERFEEIARKFPDRLAVKNEKQTLTYKELNQAANRIADAIVRRFGKENEPVAVLLDHGAAPIVAFLGLLKAAKIVVTIDPSAPIERIHRILEHSRATGMVVNSTSLSKAAGALGARRPTIDIDELGPDLSNENLGLAVYPDTLAEIVYTSGSTGEPKGVLRSHRFYLPSIKGREANHVCSNDRFLNLHAATASGFFLDSFRALFAGAAVFPFNTKKNGLSCLADWLVQEEITILRAFSSVFRSFGCTLPGERQFPRLRRIELGGESLWKSDVDLYKKKFSDDCVLTFVLAGSETGKICQFEIDKHTEIADDIVPVGRSFEETAVLLLDERGNEVGPGEIGEIAVRSRYLALGYWSDAALTQEKFLADPDGGDERIYLTGDLGRFLPNGCLTHLGREDFLVKIRGYRVSLVGIEGALLAHPAVKQAAVIALDSEAGEKSLAAYVVPRNEPPPKITQLSEFLRKKLPDYMVPSAFVFLKELPQTNGKIDRRSLPQPSRVRPDLDEPCIDPKNEVEAKLVRFWETILDIRPIGIHDNFLDLGGHSLLAVRLLAEIEKEFNKRIPLSNLFERPTIEHLASLIRQTTPLTSQSSLVAIQPRGAKSPFFCVHELFGDVLFYMTLARRFVEDRTFYALYSR
jgi:amino acid adenylation domain-containing protein